jgi:hypothetical protein
MQLLERHDGTITEEATPDKNHGVAENVQQQWISWFALAVVLFVLHRGKNPVAALQCVAVQFHEAPQIFRNSIGYRIRARSCDDCLERIPRGHESRLQHPVKVGRQDVAF